MKERPEVKEEKKTKEGTQKKLLFSKRFQSPQSMSIFKNKIGNEEKEVAFPLISNPNPIA